MKSLAANIELQNTKQLGWHGMWNHLSVIYVHLWMRGISCALLHAASRTPEKFKDTRTRFNEHSNQNTSFYRRIYKWYVRTQRKIVHQSIPFLLMIPLLAVPPYHLSHFDSDMFYLYIFSHIYFLFCWFAIALECHFWNSHIYAMHIVVFASQNAINCFFFFLSIEIYFSMSFSFRRFAPHFVHICSGIWLAKGRGRESERESPRSGRYFAHFECKIAILCIIYICCVLCAVHNYYCYHHSVAGIIITALQ